MDSDPMRLSAASLLLAAVWCALDSPDDAPRLVREGHEHAVQAALEMADAVYEPAPPKRRSLAPRLLLGPLPKVTWRNAFRGRPKSARIQNSYAVSMFGRTVLAAEQYAATRKAREDESTLLGIDGYVRALGAIRIKLGDQPDTVPQYRIGLTQRVSATTRMLGVTASTTFYALSYERATETESVPAPTELLSEEIPRGAVRLLPDRD